LQSIVLGGFHIQVELEAGLDFLIQPHLGPLFPKESPKNDADIHIKVAHQENYSDIIKNFHHQKSFFETDTAWKIVEDKDHFHFGPVEHCDFDPMLPHVLTSKDFTKIQVLTDTKQITNAYPLDEIIADHFLALNDGIIVHASGLKIDGEGVLFLGDSGAGKSTIAEFFVNEYGKDAILCDDRMIIRHIEGKWMAYGSPWHGTYNHFTTQGVPLKAMYFIEQSGNHRFHPINQSEIFERLTRVSFLCWWLRDYSAKQLQTIQSIVMSDQVETRVLEFLKDQSVVNYVSENRV
jgi:hypothetical protein